MIKRKLTDRQKVVLRYLLSRNPERNRAVTEFEIAQACWGTGVFTCYEQVQRTSKQLVARGLVKAVGFSLTAAQCFVATDAAKGDNDDDAS